jgi:queuosine precursor transporter
MDLQKTNNEKYLISVCMIFYMLLLSASIAGQKLLSVFGVVFSAGSLIFPITYMTIACITEVYGLKRARQVIITGAFCNLFVSGYLFVVIKVPHASFWVNQAAFEKINLTTSSILLMSTVAYLASEYVNAKIIAKLKILLQGKWLLGRAITSTAIAAIVDSTLMLPIIFFNSPNVILKIFFTLITLKILYEIALLPFYWLTVEFLKKEESTTQDVEPEPYSSVSFMAEKRKSQSS